MVFFIYEAIKYLIESSFFFIRLVGIYLTLKGGQVSHHKKAFRTIPRLENIIYNLPLIIYLCKKKRFINPSENADYISNCRQSIKQFQTHFFARADDTSVATHFEKLRFLKKQF